MALRGLGNRLKTAASDAGNIILNILIDGGERIASVAVPAYFRVLRTEIQGLTWLVDWWWEQAKKVWNVNQEFFADVARFFGSLLNKGLGGGKATLFDSFATYLNSGNFDPQIKDAITKYFHQSNDIAEFFAALGIPGSVFNTILNAETSTYVERTRQKDLQAERITTLDVGAMMQMWQREGVSHGTLTDHLARQGLPNEIASYIEAATKQYLPLVQLAIAAQRTGGSDGPLNEAAANLGYNAGQVAAAKLNARNYSPLNVLALAAQRGGTSSAFVRSTARELGMTDADADAAIAAARNDANLAMLAIAAQHGDVPESAVTDAARKQGLSETDARAAMSAARAFAPLNVLALALQRKDIDRASLDASAHKQGLDATDISAAISAARTLLTPITLVQAKWRGTLSGGSYVEQMAKAGYDAEAAATFESVALFLPTPQDLVTWISKEVFELDSITKYGLDDEFEKLDLELFAKIGISKEQARNYWVSHWQHPSFTQVGEMFIRDILVDPQDRNRVTPGSPEWSAVRSRAVEEVYEWFRLVEVPPYWRRRMIEMLYQPYTRVDIRRMWDLDVVGDDDVLRAYLDQGYDIEHANNLLAFTKVERGYPDLVARYKNGWLSQAEVLETLTSYGVSPETATRLFQRKFANLEQPTRVATERDLTKTEIIKGVQKQFLTADQGVAELMRLGYDEAEAQLIILINVDFTSSPETPLEFRRGTEAYRKAIGKSYIEIPDSLIALERAMLAAKRTLDDAEKRNAPTSEVDALRTAWYNARVPFETAYKRLGL